MTELQEQLQPEAAMMLDALRPSKMATKADATEAYAGMQDFFWMVKETCSTLGLHQALSDITFSDASLH